MQDEKAIIDDFPATFETQDDILQGLNIIARAALQNEIPAIRVDPIRKILETAARTIAMRDTVKQNDKPRPQRPINMQVNNIVGAPPSPAQISAYDDFLNDEQPGAYGAMKVIAAHDPPIDDAPAAPLPQAEGTYAQVKAGKSDLRASKGAFYETLRSRNDQ